MSLAFTISDDDGDVHATHALAARFFGGFDVHVGGQPVHRWKAGRSRSLLQYLLIHQGERVARDRLYEAIWPDAEWRSDSSSLKVACHGVRNVLGASRDGSGTVRLLYRDRGYVLEADDVWLDVTEFQRLLIAGLDAAKSGRTETARRDLSSAMKLYRADFLDGDSADWVIEYREYFKSLALQALQALRWIAEREAHAGDLVRLCRRTLDLDRHHEPSYRTLIAHHGRLGELERARSWYLLCTSLLRQNLNVAPESATIDTYRRVLQRPVMMAPDHDQLFTAVD
jgi:DNA-binding SARP family transcriptional activator